MVEQPKKPLLRKDVLPAVLLSVLVVGAFLPALQCGFVDYDDQQYVYENPHVVRGITADGLRWLLTAEVGGNWHPVTMLSHQIDCELFGLNPAGHHATSLVLHLVNVLLLYVCLVQMTGRIWPGLFVAALFAVHPLNVESVVWIAERKNVLSTLFLLLTVLLYIRYARRSSIVWLVFMMACYQIGLMAKPMLVTLPLLLACLDYWPLDRIWRSAGGAFNAVKEQLLDKLPLLCLAAANALATIKTQAESGSVVPLHRFSLTERVVLAVINYVTYPVRLFFPDNLCVLYPRPSNINWMLFFAALVMLAGFSVFAVRMRKRLPYLMSGWCWYLLSMLPVVGLISVGSQSTADRYAYVPLIGVFLIIGWAMADLAGKGARIKMLVCAVSAGWVLVLVPLTRAQTGYWQSSRTLFERAVKICPQSHGMVQNLGQTLFKSGDVEAAIPYFRQAITLDPDNSNYLNNLGYALTLMGETAEAEKMLRRSLEISPEYALAHCNMGICLMQQGQMDEAESHFKRAIELDPELVAARRNMGHLLMSLGRPLDAVNMLLKAAQLAPYHVKVRGELIQSLIKAGKPERALPHALDACKLTGYKLEAPMIWLARSAEAAGKPQQAVEAWYRALDLATARGNTNLIEAARKGIAGIRGAQP